MGHVPALPHRARAPPAEGRPRLRRHHCGGRLRGLRLRGPGRPPGDAHRQHRLDRERREQTPTIPTATSRAASTFGGFGSSSVSPLPQLLPVRAERRVMTGFRSMGCDVLVSSAARLHEVRRLFEERDRRFSRFLDHSELNRVNALPFGVTLVSEELASMLSLRTRRRSRHRRPGDPGRRWRIARRRLRPRLRRAAPRRRRGRAGARCPRSHSLRLRGRMLLRTEPVVLDLNGVVKGRTVDDALALRRPTAGSRPAATSRRRVPLVVGAARRRLGHASTAAGSRRAASRSARWRRGGERAAPSDRPGHRPPGAHALARRDRRRRRLPRGRRRREGRAAARRSRAGVARPPRPRRAASSTTTAQSRSTRPGEQPCPTRLAA